MCLNKITKTNLDESGVGWKVFVMREGKLCGDIQSPNKRRVTNKWLREEDFRQCTGLRYSYGFHIFKSKEGAKKWVYSFPNNDRVIKVKYRKGHTSGIQRGFNIIVAKEMLILPNQLK